MNNKMAHRGGGFLTGREYQYQVSGPEVPDLSDRLPAGRAVHWGNLEEPQKQRVINGF